MFLKNKKIKIRKNQKFKKKSKNFKKIQKNLEKNSKCY